MRESLPRRREFLRQVGQGMVAAGLGQSLRTVSAADEIPTTQRLRFPKQDRLVDLLQETAVSAFLPAVIRQLQTGTTLRELVSAAALANARAFGGEDYVGFHTFMAFAPSLRLSGLLTGQQSALPVLKVLYRQAAQLEAIDHHHADTLHAVPQQSTSPASSAPQHRETILAAVHAQNRESGDQTLAAAARTSPELALNSLLPAVFEAPEVHRIVLVQRAWDMLELVGREHADTMLRQSLHYCVKMEPHRNGSSMNVAADVFEQIARVSELPAPRSAAAISDQWIRQFADLLLSSGPTAAVQAAADALLEGVPAAAISEAVSVAANQLLLRDPGRPEQWAQPNKPAGSVHGDSIGVHASDTAHAWKQIVQVSEPDNSHAAVILSALCVARDAGIRFSALRSQQSVAEYAATINEQQPETLLGMLEDCVHGQQQSEATAITAQYLQLGHDPQQVFRRLLSYACSEDGALHGEKYYCTAHDEFSRIRPEFRNGELLALARVTASEYGTPAPGYAEALELLKLL